MALQASLDEKGEMSYYYAHKRKDGALEAPIVSKDEAPSLLEKAPKEDRLQVCSIKRFGWYDDGKAKVKVVVDTEELGAIRKEDVALNFSPHGFELKITVEERKKQYVLSIDRLYDSVKDVSLLVRRKKIVLKLKKTQELTWFALKEQKKKM